MTEKRYKLFEHKGCDYILDNPNESLDFIEMLGDALSSEEIVDRLNQIDELDEENQKLDEKVCLLTRDLIKTKSYDQLEKEFNRIKNKNKQLKSQNQRLSEQKHIYKQDWKHLCIDKELLEEEIEQLKEETNYLKHALRRLVENFDDKISKSSPVRELII